MARSGLRMQRGCKRSSPKSAEYRMIELISSWNDLMVPRGGMHLPIALLLILLHIFSWLQGLFTSHVAQIHSLTCPIIEHMNHKMLDFVEVRMPVLSRSLSPLVVAFPVDAITNCLRDELSQIARDDAVLTGRVLPAEQSALSHTSVELDSLRVVSILCRLDELVGFEVKDVVVKHGGYGSIDGALRHLLPRIQKEWDKHQASRGGRS